MAQTRKRRSKGTKPETEKKKETPKKEDKPRGLRLDFMDALTAINPGIASDSIIEQSDLVLMDNDRLISYNDEIAVSHPFPIQHYGGVAAAELLKLLQKLPSDEIEIRLGSVEKGDELVIVCGDIEAGFFLTAEISIPDLGIGEIKEWVELPADFCQAVEFCLSSAATDMTKGIMTCVNVNEDTVISCDNFRATKYNMKTGLPEDFVLDIPRKAAKDLASYHPTEVAKDESWIHFRNRHGTVFSTRTMTDEYPDVMKLFEGVEGKTIVLPKEIKKVLDRVGVMAATDEKTGDRVVDIAVMDDVIECSGEGVVGWATEKTRVNFSDEVPKFSISPKLLSDILDITQNAILTDRIIFFEGQDFSHLVSLVARPS